MCIRSEDDAWLTTLCHSQRLLQGGVRTVRGRTPFRCDSEALQRAQQDLSGLDLAAGIQHAEEVLVARPRRTWGDACAAHCIDWEMASRPLDKGRELGIVRAVSAYNFDGGEDVRGDAAHQVGFHPVVTHWR
jgi:hypothetical protein